MSHEPPVPPEAISPYPLEPAPNPKKRKRATAETRTKRKPREAREAIVARKHDAAAQTADRSAGASPAPAGHAEPDTAINQRPRESEPATGKAKLGTALAVGAAAAVAGLLFTRRKAPNANGSASAKRLAQSASRKKGEDTSKRGAADRRRVAAGQAYEVTYFARKHAITASQARAIIKAAGSDRAKANELAKDHKRK